MKLFSALPIPLWSWSVYPDLPPVRAVYSLGQVTSALAEVSVVAGDSGQFSAAVVLVMDVVGDVFQVLHVSPGEHHHTALSCSANKS